MPSARILIIGDEKSIRDRFATHLEDRGYKVLIAENGRLGLSLFKQEAPDLVIVDLNMPEVHGLQVLETISRHSPLTPLLVASDTGNIGDTLAALHRGAWEYLHKPIEHVSMLTHAVDSCLERGRLKRENRALRGSEARPHGILDPKKLDDQLRHAQKLEALGILAGGIAHDFNNILSVVLGYSELGLLDLGDPAHPLYPKLKAINQAGHRARALVEQILTLSRMQEQAKAPLKISPILKEALKLLQSSLPANIKVKSTIASERLVLCDPTQIHQIIMNLFTNAYDALQTQGGVLDVSLAQVTIDASGSVGGVDIPPGRYLQLTVADTGPGIDPAIIDRIFDPYFTTKDKARGTGLGLAAVRDIVNHHGGEISVQSHLGEGTRVSVLLPIYGDKSVKRGEFQVGFQQGTGHVLLVDDEKELVEIGTDMLSRLGYRVTAVIGSAAALEAFEKAPHRFDIVVADYDMPGMTGEELARRMLATRRDTPIIVCTGFSEAFDQRQAKACGIQGMLAKPVTIESLAHAVREVLASR